MYYHVILLPVLVVSAVACFIFTIRGLLDGTSKKISDEIKKVFVTITNDNIRREYPYTFKQTISKDPKILLGECEKERLKPSNAEEAKRFISQYSIMAHDNVIPTYYKEYGCWGMELKKGEIALVMERV
ncbi:MAG: hypothetical protein UT05_C0009G0073 [Parcubacteria group bacterium GW2011_GWF2_38_76]|nr:MAG: hypothetical protein UT05_C0009G0073 [Parcubacteria group bacterium GW2011_GWF2_38_76]HBM45514.1 hypothetical protein [Patescibacteria group bacterium]